MATKHLSPDDEGERQPDKPARSLGNDDWIKREQGRIPTKGAMAAERASAGLGTSDDDTSMLFRAPSPPVDVWARPVRKTSRPHGKPAPRL